MLLFLEVNKWAQKNPLHDETGLYIKFDLDLWMRANYRFINEKV